jgi:ferredoxin-NADP reductase
VVWGLPGAHGRDPDALRRIAPDIGRHRLYVCGPEAWMDAVCAAAGDAGVPPARIHTERFAW